MKHQAPRTKDQEPRTKSQLRKAAGFFFAVLGALLAHPGTAYGQSDDAVVVLMNGGVENVEVFDLAFDPEPRPVRLGQRRIVPAELGPVRVSDIKILPDGSHLLADVDGRGAAVTTPDGDSLRWVLDPMQRFTDVDSATVGSYFAPGEPSLIVTGDSQASTVAIRSSSQREVVWFASVRLTTSRGLVPQVVVMPQNRIAMAVNWDAVGVWGIELRDISDPIDEGMTIVSEAHSESPPDAVVVPELDVIRELMVLDDGRFLVTTRYALLLLNADGTLDQAIDIGELDGVSGELASVRVLGSGRWALATFEPGEWVRPHTNHRLHWYDPELSEIVVTSEPLARAPLRVEPQAGHGGTGTVGFDGGLDDLDQGDAEDLDLESLVIPSEVRVGTELSVRATITNSGSFPVGLAQIFVRGSVGECSGELVAAHDFAVASAVTVAAGATFSFSNDEPIDSRFELGEWCAYVQAIDRQGTVHDYPEPVSFTVVEAGTGPGSTVDVRPLPFGTGGEDAGDVGMDADSGSGGGGGGGKDGCCATADSRAGSSLWLLLVVMGLLSGRRLSAAGRVRR